MIRIKWSTIYMIILVYLILIVSMRVYLQAVLF